MKTIQLIRGDRVELLLCRGYHVSSASAAQLAYNQNNETPLDLVPFLMSNLCLVNSERKSIDYFINLLSEDYTSIGEGLSEILEIID